MRIAVVACLLAACGRLDFAATGGGDGGPAVDSAKDVGDVGSDAASFPDANPAVAWSFVQAAGTIGSTGSFVTPTGANHLVVVAVHHANSSTITGVTDDSPLGTSSYARVLGSAIDTSANNAVELWFTAASHPGATAAVVLPNAGTIVVATWEFATRTPATFDSSSTTDNNAATLTPIGPVLGTTHAGDIIVTAAISPAMIIDLSGGGAYVEDLSTNNGGWAHYGSLAAPISPPAAEWSSQDATYCAIAAAFAVP